MSHTQTHSRGWRWLAALAGEGQQAPSGSDGADMAPQGVSSAVIGPDSASMPQSVRVRDAWLAGEPARYIAVVPDPDNPFPRARQGEVGLLEGWALARAVRAVMRADAGQSSRRPIIAVVDVRSQAYGRREEALGIHQSLASAAAAYAEARLAGHPIIGLIVGPAMSGAFLAHGYQANRLIALDDPGVMVHAMGKAAAARITLRTVEQLEALASKVPPMAYDIGSFERLGLLWRRLSVERPDDPADADIQRVRSALTEALADIRADADPDLSGRWQPSAGSVRQHAGRVRAQLRAVWAHSRSE